MHAVVRRLKIVSNVTLYSMVSTATNSLFRAFGHCLVLIGYRLGIMSTGPVVDTSVMVPHAN